MPIFYLLSFSSLQIVEIYFIIYSFLKNNKHWGEGGVTLYLGSEIKVGKRKFEGGEGGGGIWMIDNILIFKVA